jgi:hypothetical protein
MEIVLTGAWVLGVLMLVTMAGLPVLQALAETARNEGSAQAEEGNPALDETGVLWAPVSVPAQRTASPAPVADTEHVAC